MGQSGASDSKLDPFGFGMIDPQGQALREIADRRMSRDDVALTYAFALRQGETDRIAEVNRAILNRWSMAALKYIKTRAWKLADHREDPDA